MATLKRLLKNTDTELFRNWDDTNNEVSAVGITLCNTSASDVKVWVSFIEFSGVFINGAIFSGLTVNAHSSAYREIPKRVLAMDDTIRAYAETADVIAFSVDLIGVDQRLIPPDPES